MPCGVPARGKIVWTTFSAESDGSWGKPVDLRHEPRNEQRRTNHWWLVDARASPDSPHAAVVNGAAVWVAWCCYGYWAKAALVTEDGWVGVAIRHAAPLRPFAVVAAVPNCGVARVPYSTTWRPRCIRECGHTRECPGCGDPHAGRTIVISTCPPNDTIVGVGP